MIHARRRTRRYLALALAVCLVAGACGGGKKGGSGDGTAGNELDPGDPVRGGSVTYGVEAETGDGWCLQESQLAISGILVARAIYDTLTVPNSEGEYVPYLAEAVEPNDSYTEWTITLRDGVKFHDGTDLTGEVVKNNLDAYRGKVGPAADGTSHPTRSPLLFLFVLDNIDNVEATGDLEVKVTTKVPWVAFPAFLHSTGRLGMTAQAQLDNPDACNRDLIGTGPFKFESWSENKEFKAVRNENYWQEAPDGEPYPYLEEIKFVPVFEATQRRNQVESGDLSMAHFSSAPDMKYLRDLEQKGDARYYESNANAEVSFVQINNERPPLNDVRLRRAAALAMDPEEYTEVINEGEFEMASGPFGPESIAYLEDTGFPREQNLEEARRLVAEYEAENGPIRPISYQATPGAITLATATFVQQTLEEVGVTVNIEQVQQDALIDNAIAGEYDIMGFRNYPGGDPDLLYNWFYGTSPVNFGNFNDEEVNRLLDEGRSEPDPEKRAAIYQDLNRRMGEQVYSVWANYTTWMVASNENVFGYDPETVPTLPNGDKPTLGLADGNPLLGLWVKQ